MKKMKKIASLILAMVMVLSLATTAFAADTETTYTYEIYQIFTGDYANGVLSNIKWGANGTGTKGDAVAEAVLKELSDVNTATDAEQLAVIEKYANLESTPFTTTEAVTTTTTTVNNLANGYYLVKDVDNTQEGKNQAYTTYVVQVVNGTLTINRKADVPEVEKKIVESAGKVDANNTSIGKTVNYEFTGDMPTNIADYDTYYYVFTDTLSKGLTLTDPEGAATNDIKVTVNGIDVTNYFHISATDYSATAGTTITVGMQDILALEQLTAPVVGDITAATKVVVTYSAVLNENAVVGVEGNPNDVKLEYSNNPNDDGEGSTTPEPNPEKPVPSTPTGETPKDEVITYTTELIVKKTDENGNILPGAAFKIEGEGVKVVVTTGEYFVEDTTGTYYKLKDGSYTTTVPVTDDDPDTTDKDERNSDAYESTTITYRKETKVTLNTADTSKTVTAEAFVDSETGLLTFTGLGAGTYTITETVTPAGYNSIAPIEVTINWDATNGFTYVGTDYNDVNGNKQQDEGEVNTNQVTIVNKSGSTLPETGGMGTTIFYLAGGILVLAAVVLLVTKKRMSAE